MIRTSFEVTFEQGRVDLYVFIINDSYPYKCQIDYYFVNFSSKKSLSLYRKDFQEN